MPVKDRSEDSTYKRKRRLVGEGRGRYSIRYGMETVTQTDVAVGSIVRFCNRDWVVVGEENDSLHLRPLTGTSDDVLVVHRLLSKLLGYTIPSERIATSQFPLPDGEAVADLQSVQLLWQASRLLLREGATPFRSLGRISFRPLPYQLVPLMMALRLNPVRLLIADDVGVGKTVEAGLILRELWDRGEVRRAAILCPPYLCDWWQKELGEKFHLYAVVIGSGTIASLERQVPPGRTIYEHFPVQVISIDFIKLGRNKSGFLADPPEFIIVDEAHGVVPSGRGSSQHMRYELVKALASDPRRHLVLLTATPHSGIPEAFQRLLGLLDESFEKENFSELTEEQRKRLAQHFVQRTRGDISKHWHGGKCFPQREPIDVTYQLSPEYRELFWEVYKFCEEIVRNSEQLEENRQRIRLWSAFNLLQCVMSSPRAARVALEKRSAADKALAESDEYGSEDIYESESSGVDEEVPRGVLNRLEAKELSKEEKEKLEQLRTEVEKITEDRDNKLQGCVEQVSKLLREGYNPVIWCFYVDTAEYVAEALQKKLAREFPDVHVVCITGRVNEEERRLKVEELLQKPRRVLVATDCLSEGINLQDGFDAVLHYDLHWNPNRLEQREGRVDRYGQKKQTVKAIRYYGTDNPVDGAVIKVLLDKACNIRRTLGTYVPIPADEQSVVEALVHALFWKRKERDERQIYLPYLEAFDVPKVRDLHRRWEMDIEREKESRSRFAQRALKPEEVMRELEATDRVLGDPEAVRQFVLLACQKLGIPIEQSNQNEQGNQVVCIITERATIMKVPDAIRRELPNDSRKRWLISFVSPTPEGAEYIGRNHPFVTALARYFFEQALEGKGQAGAARCGAIRTREVSRLTSLLLVRSRYQLQRLERAPLLAEEVLVIGFEGFGDRWLPPDEALNLLMDATPTTNLSIVEKKELVAHVRDEIRDLLKATTTENPLRTVLERRARELQEAHRRVRQSVGQPVRGFEVRLHWPPDILGILVLQPELEG